MKTENKKLTLGKRFSEKISKTFPYSALFACLSQIKGKNGKSQIMQAMLERPLPCIKLTRYYNFL